jgi:hypothetical protein
MIGRNFEFRLKWRDESLVKDASRGDPANRSLSQEGAVSSHFLLFRQPFGNRAGWPGDNHCSNRTQRTAAEP